MMHHRVACRAGIIAVIAGIIITWISGFFTPLFPERTVDVLQWGSPFPYLHRVVTFHTAPFVDWTMAFVDFLVWSVIVFVILCLAWPKGSGRDRPSRSSPRDGPGGPEPDGEDREGRGP